MTHWTMRLCRINISIKNVVGSSADPCALILREHASDPGHYRGISVKRCCRARPLCNCINEGGYYEGEKITYFEVSSGGTIRYPAKDFGTITRRDFSSLRDAIKEWCRTVSVDLGGWACHLSRLCFGPDNPENRHCNCVQVGVELC